MNRRWLMRVSSNPECGRGHLNRSGPLALALAERASVTVLLDAGWVTWPERFAHQAIEVFGTGGAFDGSWHGAILDSYALSAEEIAALAAQARPLVVMDDFLRPPPQTDLVVNAAIDLEGDSIDGVPALLGPSYACIDPAFAVPSEQPILNRVDSVLVSLGMVDPGNATGRVLAAFARLHDTGIAPRLTVVMGSRAPHLAAVRNAVSALEGQARLVVDAADMASLMREADLIVGSGGVGLFERLALGIPSLTLVTAENQRLFVEGAARVGATVSADATGQVGAVALADTIGMIIGDAALRRSLRKAGRGLIDGKGAERIAGYVTALAAEMADRDREEMCS